MKTSRPLSSSSRHETTTGKRRANLTDAFSRRVYRLYNAPLALLLGPLGAYTLWRRYVKKKSAMSLRGQWGHVPRDVVEALHGAKKSDSNEAKARGEADAGARMSTHAASTHVVWIHAVSVGETIAARPVVRSLREAMPDCRIALSVTTDTGYETAQAAKHNREVDAVFYFPLDSPIAIRRALRSVRPDAFLTMETELWPNFLHLARSRGTRAFLVNGRVSDNLLRTAPRLGPIWKWMMRNLDGCLMRSSFDAERMIALGGTPEQVRVTGDVKLDSVSDDNSRDAASVRARWRATLQIAPDVPLWIAGSTHDGEEEIVLETWVQLCENIPNLRLLLAPRHIERSEDIIALARRLNLAIVRRTESPSGPRMSTHVAGESRAEHSGNDGNMTRAAAPLNEARATVEKTVILLDTVGELGEIYAAGDVAFVGGSLIERGGHNVLEPVLRGVPVAFGPHVANFREAALLVESARGGKMVNDRNELRQTLEQWLQNDLERQSVAARALEALSEHRGAAQRVAQIVAQALN